MVDCDLRDQIERLESDIEQLAELLDRCRKAMALAKVAIAAGESGYSPTKSGQLGLNPRL